jgi:hypothetical protein
VSHFAELWYVFDHLNQESWSWSSADRKVAEEISSYWVNFARSGNPNSPDLPSWPPFTNTDSKVLAIGDPITVDGVTNINGLKVSDDVYTGVRGQAICHAITDVRKDALNRVPRHNIRQFWADNGHPCKSLSREKHKLSGRAREPGLPDGVCRTCRRTNHCISVPP